MHKLLSDRETTKKHGNEETWDGTRRLLVYLRQGGACLLTGVTPGVEGRGRTGGGQHGCR